MGNAEALVMSQQIDSSHSRWPSLFTACQTHGATLIPWRRAAGVGSWMFDGCERQIYATSDVD